MVTTLEHFSRKEFIDKFCPYLSNHFHPQPNSLQMGILYTLVTGRDLAYRPDTYNWRLKYQRTGNELGYEILNFLRHKGYLMNPFNVCSNMGVVIEGTPNIKIKSRNDFCRAKDEIDSLLQHQWDTVWGVHSLNETLKDIIVKKLKNDNDFAMKSIRYGTALYGRGRVLQILRDHVHNGSD